jgi:hypothetical protein
LETFHFLCDFCRHHFKCCSVQNKYCTCNHVIWFGICLETMALWSNWLCRIEL